MCCCNEKNPVGTVNYFARQFPPEGWLLCDGREVSRDVFADLYNMVGISFGTGDGKTTFNLPDLRGEFIRGLDEGRGIDSDRKFGSVQTDTLKKHNHYFFETNLDPTANGDSTDADVPCCMDTGGMATATSDHRFVSNTGDTETHPRNVALLACIKY
ncbi:MAG: hypothetical protein H6Q70_2780 [Firmicutes bacterium]|nr:hypothetical protein [Bacillota bacterium]